jgi:drug/metabolite transporter (DMT)-like permease
MIIAAKKIKNPFKSIYYIVVAGFVLTIHDGIIKWISDTYPVHEIVLIRSCIAIIPILMIAHWRGGLSLLRTNRYFGHIIRSLLMFGTYLCFYLALSALPLAETISLFFSSPIFITILSVLFLKEKVELTSWIAVFTGFIGVIIMLKPGSEMIDPAAFLAVLSALLYATGSIMTRSLGKTESSLSMTFYLMVVYIVSSTSLAFALNNITFNGDPHPSLAFFFRAWQLPVTGDLFFFLCIGLIASVGIYCLSQAYSMEEPSKIAPFEYLAVPLSVVWGYIFWNDVLELQSIIGIILIIGSGLYILHGKRI